MSIFTTLASFNGSDGSNPVGKLVADSEGDLFGVTATGGPNDDGVVFEVARVGDGYVSTPIVLADLGRSTGVDPTAGLVIDAAGDLFGVTTSGGTDDTGTIFEVAKTAGSYESTPTVLATFEVGANLVEDANGDLFGTSGNSVFELTKTGTSYASQPTTIVTLGGSEGGLVTDQVGNLFGLENILEHDVVVQSIFEVAKSGSSYAPTQTDLSQIVGFPGNGAQIGNLVVDQAGDIFGTYGTETSGKVFEIVNTSSGLESSATTLATFSGSGGFHDHGLSADATGDLYGVWGDELFEITKDDGVYAVTPRIYTVNGPGGSTTVGQINGAPITTAGGDVVGAALDGGANGDGSIYEFNPAAAPELTLNSAIGQAEATTQTLSGEIDTADANLQVSIFDNSTLVGTATPAADGDWTASIDLSTTPGSQTVTAQATNSAGATGTSNAVVYAVNSAVPPAFSVLRLTTGGGLNVGSGDGDVKLFDLSGNDTLRGGAGDEALHVGAGVNSMVAGSGRNTLFSGSGSDTLVGGGQSRLVAGSGNELLIGGLTATARDTMIGGGGRDTLRAAMGNNVLIAGSGFSTGVGQDTLKGGSGPSAVLNAGSGAQRLVGSSLVASTDTLRGGAGLDTLVSINGNDRLIAGTGEDVLRGGSGDDTIVAGSGRNSIYGGTGNSRILLEASGQAVVHGGAGNNKVFVGATGNDSIFGGVGVTNVYTAQADNQVSNEFVNAASYLEITFTDGQVLSLQGVTIHFQGGGVIHS